MTGHISGLENVWPPNGGQRTTVLVQFAVCYKSRSQADFTLCAIIKPRTSVALYSIKTQSIRRIDTKH